MVLKRKRAFIPLVNLVVCTSIIRSVSATGHSCEQVMEEQATKITALSRSGEKVQVKPGRIKDIRKQLSQLLIQDVVIVQDGQVLDDANLIIPGTVLNFISSYTPTKPLEFIDWTIDKLERHSEYMGVNFSLLHREGMIDITIQDECSIDSRFGYTKSFTCNHMKPMGHWYYNPEPDTCSSTESGMDLVAYCKEKKIFENPDEDIFQDPNGDIDRDIDKMLGQLPEQYEKDPIIQFIAKEYNYYHDTYRNILDLTVYKVISRPNLLNIRCSTSSMCNFEPYQKGMQTFLKDIYRILVGFYEIEILEV